MLHDKVERNATALLALLLSILAETTKFVGLVSQEILLR